MGAGGLFFDNLGLKLARRGTSLTGPVKGRTEGMWGPEGPGPVCPGGEKRGKLAAAWLLHGSCAPCTCCLRAALFLPPGSEEKGK